MRWRIYGTPYSLFTRKLEAAMGFHGLPFESEEPCDG